MISRMISDATEQHPGAFRVREVVGRAWRGAWL